MNDLQTLVLNADFRPLSRFPLSSWHWKDAVSALVLQRVNLVAEYDHVIRSPSRAMRVPSVVALKRYLHLGGYPAFTRFNIYCRDRWCCQYCAEEFSSSELTFDHVVPRSRGGRTTWDNMGLAPDILFVLVQRVRNAICRLTVSSNGLGIDPRRTRNIPDDPRQSCTALSARGAV